MNKEHLTSKNYLLRVYNSSSKSEAIKELIDEFRELDNEFSTYYYLSGAKGLGRGLEDISSAAGALHLATILGSNVLDVAWLILHPGFHPCPLVSFRCH